MGTNARPLSLAVAAEKFKMTVAELQELIDSKECSIGDVVGTIMCSFDSKTKKFSLQRKPQAPPIG